VLNKMTIFVNYLCLINTFFTATHNFHEVIGAVVAMPLHLVVEYKTWLWLHKLNAAASVANPLAITDIKLR
jgi:hypothetical protein